MSYKLSASELRPNMRIRIDPERDFHSPAMTVVSVRPESRERLDACGVANDGTLVAVKELDGEYLFLDYETVEVVTPPKTGSPWATHFVCTPHGDWNVTQGAHEYCLVWGHAWFKEDGVFSNFCPRCGHRFADGEATSDGTVPFPLMYDPQHAPVISALRDDDQDTADMTDLDWIIDEDAENIPPEPPADVAKLASAVVKGDRMVIQGYYANVERVTLHQYGVLVEGFAHDNYENSWPVGEWFGLDETVSVQWAPTSDEEK